CFVYEIQRTSQQCRLVGGDDGKGFGIFQLRNPLKYSVVLTEFLILAFDDIDQQFPVNRKLHAFFSYLIQRFMMGSKLVKIFEVMVTHGIGHIVITKFSDRGKIEVKCIHKEDKLN